jgi:hypothetical protein
MNATNRGLSERLEAVSISARKLFCVIVREAFHGPMHPKAPGTAVPAEILEACGLDVGAFYQLLSDLAAEGLIHLCGTYPFEEICLTEEASPAQELAERCRRQAVPLENVLVNLDDGPVAH